MPVLRSMFILSGVLVFGPVSGRSAVDLRIARMGLLPTNGADDAGASEGLGRVVLGVEVAEPFGARPAKLGVGEGVGHDDRCPMSL